MIIVMVPLHLYRDQGTEWEISSPPHCGASDQKKVSHCPHRLVDMKLLVLLYNYVIMYHLHHLSRQDSPVEVFWPVL